MWLPLEFANGVALDEDGHVSYPRVCPVCRQAMIGEKSDPDGDEFDFYRCLHCGCVIKYAPRQTPEANSE